MKFKTSTLTEQAAQLMGRYVSVVSAAGDTTIVAAPGQGRRIVVVYAIVENLTQTPTTIILGEGSVANPIFLFTTEQWTVFNFFSTLGREVRLAGNTALTLNLSGAIAHNVNVYYFVEDV